MALYKLSFPGIPLLHIFSRQKHKPGKCFEGRVGMRLNDCIFCGFIYCNLPGLLRQNAGSVLLHVHADNGSDLRLPDL